MSSDHIDDGLSSVNGVLVQTALRVYDNPPAVELGMVDSGDTVLLATLTTAQAITLARWLLERADEAQRATGLQELIRGGRE